MRFNVHAGHGASNSKSCGAIGLINESDEARKVKNEVIRLLKSEGHTVFDTTVDYPNSQSDCINKIVANCNKNSVDLDISIHFNSGRNDLKGDGDNAGVEVLIYNSKTKAMPYAERVCKKISQLGFDNRGVKYNTELGVLKTKNPNMLIECCFVDDKDDIKLYDYKSMSKAIVEAILNKNINENKEEVDMNKLVVYFGDADVFAAIIVAQKHKCPVMKKSDFDNSGLKAKEVIQIGGNQADTDRFVTVKNACKYL